MSSKAIWRNSLAVPIAILGLAAAALSSGSTEVPMVRVKRNMLCVTEGTLGETPGQRISVNVPKMRAYVNRPTSQTIQAHFIYLGPTGNEARLGSGEMRRQFCLKLRAQDPCNLVYAMWRIEPESKIVVSVKTNPGQHSSLECANRGYHNIKPLRSSPVPFLRPGDTHSLRAEMNGEQLRVFVDNAMVWNGSVGADALHFEGPVGIRSDNAGLEMDLQTEESPGIHSDSVLACKSGPSESE